MSVADAADRADVAQITMRKWVARGRVRSHRTVDGRRLVSVDSIEALLEAHRIPELATEAPRGSRGRLSMDTENPTTAAGLVPRHKAALNTLLKDQAVTYTHTGGILAEIGDHELARKFLAHAARLNPPGGDQRG